MKNETDHKYPKKKYQRQPALMYSAKQLKKALYIIHMTNSVKTASITTEIPIEYLETLIEEGVRYDPQ